jgi:hypothetical protein
MPLQCWYPFPHLGDTASLIGHYLCQTALAVRLRLTQVRSVLIGLGNHSDGPRAVATSTGRTSRFSAAARRKMEAAQKARWAKYRATSQRTATAKPTLVISAAARRKMRQPRKRDGMPIGPRRRRRPHKEAACENSSKAGPRPAFSIWQNAPTA